MFERILIVDDEAPSRIALATLLRREGFDVRDVSDGAAALAACASFLPDLILLDIVMPGGMDGFEVCRRIKATPETRLTPVVLITGLSATEDRIRGINASADDFLSKPIDFNELLARTRSLLRLKQYTDELENAQGVLFSLAQSVEARDPYTSGHCERLAEMSARLGGRLGLLDDDIRALTRAGIVHDIGKVAVPDAILLKPGPLSPEEIVVMRKHPVVGERICAPLRTFGRVLPIIRHHHERHDGSGYPDGLRGDEIPLTASILQLADVYDALTTDRPYRKASPSEEALQIMDDEANLGWWNRNLFDTFRAMITEIRADAAAQKLGRAAS
jgi:putative two-component system response regulator